MKDKSGGYIGYKYSGIITLTPEIGAVLTDKPEAKTTDFGNVGKSDHLYMIAIKTSPTPVDS